MHIPLHQNFIFICHQMQFVLCTPKTISLPLKLVILKFDQMKKYPTVNIMLQLIFPLSKREVSRYDEKTTYFIRYANFSLLFLCTIVNSNDIKNTNHDSNNELIAFL